MKKLITILLCGALTFTLTACGKDEPSYTFTSSSTSETPYSEPRGNGGGTTFIYDDTVSSETHTGNTSSAESKAREDYEIDDYFGVVNILRYHGEGGKISIPSMIGGKTVTHIDEYAFRGSAVTNVTIPGTVLTIETRAFTDCKQLETLTIADGVRTIEDYAFADCSKLSIVTLPDSIREIGAEAFKNCPYLKLTYRGQTYTAVNINELYDVVMVDGYAY